MQWNNANMFTVCIHHKSESRLLLHILCVWMRKDSMLMEHSMTNIISIIVVYIIMISFE